MQSQQRLLLVLLVLLLPVLTMSPAPPAHAEPRCFPETGHCIEGRIRAYWEQNGGLPVFGLPISAQQEITIEGQPIEAQWFERNRLELHPENAPPYDVLLGRLGVDVLAQQGRDRQAFPTADAPQSGCRHFAETQQNVCGDILTAWQANGLDLGDPGISEAESLALFGLPISPLQEEEIEGQRYQVQWFERARFELHPENAPPFNVLLGLLGKEGYATTTPASGETALEDAPTAEPAPTPTTLPPPAASTQPGGFLEVSGAAVTRLGEPVFLKGVNYYPQWRPWGEMWTAWDAHQIERELQLARDELGINTVRVLLPYDLPEADAIRYLRQFVQIAGNLDMRVLVALFDFHNSFPPAGSEGEYKHFRYLRSIIGNFTGDDRIFAWDLHNEPDHYETWMQGNAQQVLGWLSRMADEVHHIAPNHLVTVGMGQYDNLWQPGPDGRRVIDYSDIISLHNYNAPDTERQLYELRQHTTKPILLQEFGWPTAPTCQSRDYTEPQQATAYRQMLDAALSEGADGLPHTAGVFAWTLRDYDSGPTIRWDSREEHYGLYRADDTLKPAAELFRAIPAPPLPAATHTSMALTRENVNEPGGPFAPKLFDGNDSYLKGWFRLAWEQFRGRDNFGRPLGEAFIRVEDERVVQYFEAAVLAWHDERMGDPSFPELTEEAKTRRTIQPVAIGSAYTAVHGIATGQHEVSDTFEQFYATLPGGGEWRMGAAITAEMSAMLPGVSKRVQYFEHGRLEFDPASGTIQIGQLGSWYWEHTCSPSPEQP